MSTRRDIRRLAMQVLYQFDLRGAADGPAIREGLAEGIDPPAVQQEAFDLALAAWENHAAADALATSIAPQWPSHRQPPVDRALLRLAYHEIASGHAPYKVAINEAVELAKEYGSEQSPAFINGVLDKMARRVTVTGTTPQAATGATGDPWLDDALRENPNDETRNPNE